MTTVINLNIFNLFGNIFGQKDNSFRTDDSSFGSRNPNRRSSREMYEGRVIDITPFSRVVEEDGNIGRSRPERLRRVGPLAEPAESVRTYDRMGLRFLSPQGKGAYVDMYY